MNAPVSLEKLDAPSSEQFSQALGKVVWLLGMSENHAAKTIATIEPTFTAPLVFKQLRIFSKGKQPVAAVTWAYASEPVRRKIEAGEQLELQDWRSGPELTVVDCVSPFMERKKVEERFLQEISALDLLQNDINYEFKQ